MSIKLIIILVALLAFTTLCVGCAVYFGKKVGRNSDSPAAPYENLGVDDFQAFIAGDNVQLLDVRSMDEYDDGHIAGSMLVDVNDSAFVANAMAVLDMQRPVAVYCRSGRRSARAASLLAAQGFTVTNLNGGVLAWQDAGKALVK